MDAGKIRYMVLAAFVTLYLPSIAAAGEEAAGVVRGRPLGTTIDAVQKRVTPSVVSLWTGAKLDRACTATIISPGGLVVTCGHVSAEAGEAVEIRLADGRRSAAKVVSKLARHERDPRRDLALVQLADEGPWPAVELGTAADISEHEALLSFGFADTGLYGESADGPPRQVRLGRRITDGGAPADLIATTIRGFGGDSGGPLFDLGGKFVGTLSGSGNYMAHNIYVSVDVLRREWKELAGDRPVPTFSSGPRPVATSAARATFDAVRAVRDAVVEVRSKDRWVGVGAVVGRGLILTKASELGSGLTVVLRDDIPALVRVAATDAEHDLALLRMSAPDMSDAIRPVEWAVAEDLPAGTLVAVATPAGFTPPVGVVSVPARRIPAIGGGLAAGVEDAEGGVRVIRVWDELNRLWKRPPTLALRAGDLVTEVGGEPVRSRSEYFERFRGAAGGPPRLVMGDKVEVTVRREGETRKLLTRLTPAHSITTQLIWPFSYRYTGFRAAVACDFNARPELGGGPVVDSAGRVLGLFIARAPCVESLVLPANEVKASLDEMIRRTSQVPYDQLSPGEDVD